MAFLHSLRQYADKAANSQTVKQRSSATLPIWDLKIRRRRRKRLNFSTNLTGSNVGEHSWSSLSLVYVLHIGDVTRNDSHRGFLRNAAWEHCYDIVSSGCNIGPTLQRFVVLKIVIMNRLL